MGRFPSDAGTLKQQRLADRATTIEHWKNFSIKFPNEQACVENLLEHLAEQRRIICNDCDSSKIEKINLRAYKCLDCGRIGFYTAGTFFQKLRCIRAMLGAIWLLENGVRFSACHFAELAGIAKSTATCIVKKLGLVIYRTMNDAKDVANSSEFARLFIRRSRCTPALEHPSAEQMIAEEKYLENPPEEQIKARNKLMSSLTDVQNKVYNLLTTTPQDLDSISLSLDFDIPTISSTIVTLELLGLAERASGDLYVRVEQNIFSPEIDAAKSCPPELRILPTSMVESSRPSMHGIARKYLQLYVANYLCLLDRNKWGDGELFSACQLSKPVYLAELEAFVTPLFVKIGRLSVAPNA